MSERSSERPANSETESRTTEQVHTRIHRLWDQAGLIGRQRRLTFRPPGATTSETRGLADVGCGLVTLHLGRKQPSFYQQRYNVWLAEQREKTFRKESVTTTALFTRTSHAGQSPFDRQVWVVTYTDGAEPTLQTYRSGDDTVQVGPDLDPPSVEVFLDLLDNLEPVQPKHHTLVQFLP